MNIQEFNGDVAVDGELAIAGNVSAMGQLRCVDKNNIVKTVMHTPRAATVVVGLEASGYSASEVDILIGLTDNVNVKLNEALDKLPAGGGSVQLLEGTYALSETINITKCTHLMGVGFSTVLAFNGFVAINATEDLQISNIKFDNQTVNNYSTVACAGAISVVIDNVYDKKANSTNQYLCDVSDDVSSVVINNIVSNIDFRFLKLVNGKTVANWDKIYINGLANYVGDSIVVTNQEQIVIPNCIKITNDIDVYMNLWQPNASLRASFIPAIATNAEYYISTPQFPDFSNVVTSIRTDSNTIYAKHMGGSANNITYIELRRYMKK